MAYRLRGLGEGVEEAEGGRGAGVRLGVKGGLVEHSFGDRLRRNSGVRLLEDFKHLVQIQILER